MVEQKKNTEKTSRRTHGRVMEITVPFTIINNDHYSPNSSDIKRIFNAHKSIQKWAFLCLTEGDKRCSKIPHWHILLELNRNYSVEQVAKWFNVDTKMVRSKYSPDDYDDELFSDCLYSIAWVYNPRTNLKTLAYPSEVFHVSDEVLLECISDEHPAGSDGYDRYDYSAPSKFDDICTTYNSNVRNQDNLTVGDIKREVKEQVNNILANKAIAFIIYGIVAILLGLIICFLVPTIIAWLASLSSVVWAIIAIIVSVVSFGLFLLR